MSTDANLAGPEDEKHNLDGQWFLYMGRYGDYNAGTEVVYACFWPPVPGTVTSPAIAPPSILEYRQSLIPTQQPFLPYNK